MSQINGFRPLKKHWSKEVTNAAHWSDPFFERVSTAHQAAFTSRSVEGEEIESSHRGC
jgi:hypothetical protein